MKSTSSALIKTVGLGALTGMRAVSGLSAVSNSLSKQQSLYYLGGTRYSFLQSPLVASALSVAAKAEMAGDKLPTAPNRIAPLGLAGRTLAGALLGAAIFKAHGGSDIQGAVLGGLVAAAAGFGSFFLRKKIAQQTNLPDPLLGFVEDAIVRKAGRRLIH